MTNSSGDHNGRLPLDALLPTDHVSGLSRAEAIRLAWRHQLTLDGDFARWDGVNLDLLDTVRLAALRPDMPPALFAGLVAANGGFDEADTGAVAAAATVAMRDPAKIRWITANLATAAASEGWHHVVLGLAGATVAVPLAEEALFNLMKKRVKLPASLSRNVQLNVWFSRRFAVRFRRRMGGKRVRIRERGATARAWSHARTSLGARVPTEWSSRHGRGVGRELDDWSRELLVDYVATFERAHPAGVPAVTSSLYCIAASAIGHAAVDPGVATDWVSLPLHVENRARAMIGLEEVPAAIIEADELRALTAASQLEAR